MKFFHTSDWHLGKLVQGVYMTEDQRFIMEQFIKAIEEEKPDAVLIAGDIYDRAVPQTEAVNLLDEILEKIVLDLKTPVLAISGNHDSPSRLNFGTKMLKATNLHINSQFSENFEPVVLKDEFGEVHFHLIPYVDPSIVRNTFQDDEIRSHDDAMKKITEVISANMSPIVRHVFVGHAFVTPTGEAISNTSESERPLSIGGAEHVSASYFSKFHYTALGHLHQAHNTCSETIRYSGSPLKYSISEENHNKGFYIVELDQKGCSKIEHRTLTPIRDMRMIEGKIVDILKLQKSNDYVYVRLLDETPVLYPMEQIRSVFPNAMHVERKMVTSTTNDEQSQTQLNRGKMDDLALFKAFYKEVKGVDIEKESEEIFKGILDEFLKVENESLVEV